MQNKPIDMSTDIELFLNKIVELMSMYVFDNQSLIGTDEYKKMVSDYNALQKIQKDSSLLIKMSTDPEQLIKLDDGSHAAIYYNKDRPDVYSINYGNAKINRQIHSTLWAVEEYLSTLHRYNQSPAIMSATLESNIEKLKKSLQNFYKIIQPSLFHKAKSFFAQPNHISTPYKTKVNAKTL